MHFAGRKVFAVFAAAVMAGSLSAVGANAAQLSRSQMMVKEASAVYHMTAPISGVGYTTTAASKEVAAGGSFELRVALQPGFQKQAPVVCVNGAQIAPLEMDSTQHTYTYVLPDVCADAAFTISALADSADMHTTGTADSQPEPETPSGFPLHYNGQTCADLTGTQSLCSGGLLTFRVYSSAAPQTVRSGNGKVGSVNAVMQAWDAQTKTSVWQVYGVASSARSGDCAGIYAQVDGSLVKLFTVQLTKPPYTCDTTMDISVKSGQQYWAKVSIAKGTKVSYTAGNGLVVATRIKNGRHPIDLGDGKDTYYLGLQGGRSGKTGLYLTAGSQQYCMFRVTVTK